MIHTRFIILFAAIILLNAAVLGQNLPVDDQIHSELIITDANELILKQSLIVDAPVSDVWPYFTESELYSKWSAPVAEINFKINGTIKANYDVNASVEDESTITIHILNYIPEKLITLQSEIPATFPAFIKESEKDFYNIIQFNEMESGGTQIISYGLGYKNNDQFKQMIGFFAQNNLELYKKLIILLE